MKQYRTKEEVLSQNRPQVTLFSPVKPKQGGVMRQGKTQKDKLVTKSWYNRLTNQQARADKQNGGR